MCKKKYLKLKTSKFREEVEFGGTIISSETVGKETVVCVLPKNARIKAFQNLKKPKSKPDVQVFLGCWLYSKIGIRPFQCTAHS